MKLLNLKTGKKVSKEIISILMKKQLTNENSTQTETESNEELVEKICSRINKKHLSENLVLKLI
jgi:hypothetical protein